MHSILSSFSSAFLVLMPSVTFYLLLIYALISLMGDLYLKLIPGDLAFYLTVQYSL